MEIQGPKLILSLTVVFIVGTFIFIVIFRALSTLEQLQVNAFQLGNNAETKSTLQTLTTIPWFLGGLYLALVGIIIYFMLRKQKEIKQPPELRRF